MRATKPNLSLVRTPSSALRVTPGIGFDQSYKHDSVLGTGFYGDFLRVDKLGLLGKKLIVSKRRTKQLIDLAASWRRSVLELRDEGVLRADYTPDYWETSAKQLRIDHWVVTRRRNGET